MNGAAMDCRQDRVLRSHSLQGSNSSLHSPGYHRHTNRPHQQNPHLQHSKAMNYSLTDHYLGVGSTESIEHSDKYSADSRQKPSDENTLDPRPMAKKVGSREPLELPVPRFEIDEHYVGKSRGRIDEKAGDSKNLDLDTRIDLLIKSKALAVMHPIFSELEESENSSDDSDSELFDSSTTKEQVQWLESADDPSTPLSRTPSPFLSRATYLFWFNKAIELKEQAKEQEKALLEQANRRLIQENAPCKIKRNKHHNEEKKPLPKGLLDDICKELKEVVKQEFITKVLENTVFSTLDNWWEEQKDTEPEVVDIKSPDVQNPEGIDKFIVSSKSDKYGNCIGNDGLTLRTISDCSSPTSPNSSSSRELKNTLGEFNKTTSVNHTEIYNIGESKLLSSRCDRGPSVDTNDCTEIVLSILETIMGNVEKQVAERCSQVNKKSNEDEPSSVVLITKSMEVTNTEEMDN